MFVEDLEMTTGNYKWGEQVVGSDPVRGRRLLLGAEFSHPSYGSGEVREVDEQGDLHYGEFVRDLEVRFNDHPVDPVIIDRYTHTFPASFEFAVQKAAGQLALG